MLEFDDRMVACCPSLFDQNERSEQMMTTMIYLVLLLIHSGLSLDRQLLLLLKEVIR